MTDLDSQIDARHREVEAVEDQARQIEARICQIPGADRLLPRRPYGTPVSGSEVGKNLTLRGLIARADAPLAAFLGIASGEHRRRDEEAAARAMQAQALQMQTEQLRAANAEAQRRREWAQLNGRSALTGRRLV
jgi:hypothetical protein